MEETHELPVLAGIGNVFRWLEECVTIISGPLLTAGLAIALVDLLTDGKLLASQPLLLYAWAISQALGVDGQLIGAAVKTGRAMRSGHPWRVAAYSILIAALGYVAYLASNVFATQQALGITTQAALGRLGMDSTSWIVARSLLAVVLVVLSGVLRYDPAKPAIETAEARTEREARELAEARHRAELRAVKAAGMRQVGAAIAGKVNPLDTPPDTTTIDASNAPASGVANGVDDALDTTTIDHARRRNNPGTKVHQSAIPSDMMSAPQLKALLSQNGVHISDEKARAIVQSTVGCEKIGTTYCARKGPLMRTANRMIESARSTDNGDTEADELGA